MITTFVIWTTPLILVAHFLLVLLNYKNLPAEIPTHFGIDGKPDAWNSKKMIYLLPVIATFMYGLMIFVNKESLINVPDTVEVHKAISLLHHINFSTQLIFILLSYLSIEVAMQRRTGLGKTYMLLFFLFILYPFIYLL